MKSDHQVFNGNDEDGDKKGFGDIDSFQLNGVKFKKKKKKIHERNLT